ncbi:MAG: ABC transporter ATP-binding protein [Zetaproteobacteria bacterium]|nr:ABC transporter ATP-binding protein [Zetaproteobacteria bacterium]
MSLNRQAQAPSILSLQGVSKTYTFEKQQVEALKQVDLDVCAGRMAAVIGRSGAGKSTLLHLAGLLDAPTTGTIAVHGRDIVGASDRELSLLRNQTIGFVFQMHNLLPEFSALENVMLPGLIAREAREVVQERALGLLQQVGLEKRGSHRPGELSGGEQQRVSIARALIMSPPVLLADEPTGNLDHQTSLKVQDLLMQLCESYGMAMLLVTHDLELASRLPHKIEMEDGRVIC